MRHDNIEHRRLRPEPFTVEGDLEFVLRTFGLPDNMDAIQAEDRFCSDEPLICSITGKSCVITMWECSHGDVPKYTLKAMPVCEAAPKVDPWVKVGTTTIDGTMVDIATMLDVSSWPIDWDRDAEGAIDLFVRSSDPWLVGGRYLLAKGSYINGSRGTALIRCDVVRRQSEIDEEMMRSVAPSINELSATMRRMDPCPECGPHGNRGEVLLASSWAKCTTCAGGKPGDLWGEVKTSSFPGAKSYTLAIGDLVFDEEAEVKRGPQAALSSTLIAEGASAEVVQAGVRAFIDALNKPPTSFMDARREALRDLRSILLDRPDDMSVEDFRRMVLGGGTVP